MTCPPRWATPRTDSRATLGDTAAAIAEALGTPLMPWQKHVLDVALEVDDIGRLVYRDVGLSVPRQSGKTTLALVLILLRALREPNQEIRYTAQTGMDARKKWVDGWLPALEHSPFSKYFNTRMANGHEALIFGNGSIQSLVSTTSSAGHGSTVDLAILDESFAHTDARLEQALRPAMLTRPDPQLWVVSTAGTPDRSPYLLGKVEAGRQFAEAGLNEGVAYFEWSAAEDADPASPETWRSCMPALGITVEERAVVADFRAMDLVEFKRAYLNLWTTAMVDSVIPLDTWAGLIDVNSNPIDPVVFAFDVMPDRSQSSIAVAGKRYEDDGTYHVEVADHRPGTAWVPDRLAELVEKHRPSAVLYDPASPADSLTDALQAARLQLTAVSAREYAQACGVLYDSALQGTVRHLGQVELTTALDGAARRSVGDAWKWSRKSSSVDISPLVASTLALWGAQKAPPAPVLIVSLDKVVAELRAKREAAKREEGAS